MVAVKVCGLTRIEDADLAIQLGAAAIGIVLEPSSPRCVAPDADILRWLPGVTGVRRTAVFGPCQGRDVPGGFDAVQAIDVTSWPGREAKWLALREGRELAFPSGLAGVVVDAFDASAYGGTGRRVDEQFWWMVRETWHGPLWLAGGLDPDNVADLVERLRPDGVDISSGLEADVPGLKDHAKMRAFFAALVEGPSF